MHMDRPDKRGRVEPIFHDGLDAQVLEGGLHGGQRIFQAACLSSEKVFHNFMTSLYISTLAR